MCYRLWSKTICAVRFTRYRNYRNITDQRCLKPTLILHHIRPNKTNLYTVQSCVEIPDATHTRYTVILLDTDLSRYWWSRARCSRGRTSCLRSSQARPSESCRPSPWSCRPCPPSASRHGWSSQSTRHRLPISLQPADSLGYMSICQTYRFWLQFWFWEIMLLSVSSYSHDRQKRLSHKSKLNTANLWDFFWSCDHWRHVLQFTDNSVDGQHDSWK